MNSYVQHFRAAISRSDARTRSVIAVAGATYLGRFGQGIAVLVTLPLARRSLEPELFGVWMMLSALIGFMAFADLGIGNGVLNHSTRAKASNDPANLRRVIASGYAITGFLGALLLLAWGAWSLASAEPTRLAGHISVHNRPEVYKAMAVFAVVLALNVPASLILRIQLGVQQGYLNGVNQAACAVLTIILVPLTLYLGGGVPALIMTTIGVQMTANVINSLAWLRRHRIFSEFSLVRSLDAGTMRDLLRTGAMFFVLQLAVAFAYQSDAIVITQTLGQTAYGDFAVVQKLFLFIAMIVNSAIQGLWPAFGDALERGQKAWALTALKRSIKAAATFSFFSAAALALAMPWILQHWMNSSIQPVWGLILALATWTVIDAVGNVVGSFMNGANILKAQLFLALLMAGLAFTLKWVLAPVVGTKGVILGTILAYTLISVPAQIYILKQFFNSKE